MVVEDVRECAIDDADAIATAITELKPKKSPSGYMQAVCGVYTPKRLIRRVSLEPKRIKDPAYLGEVLNQKLRVEFDKYNTVVVNANNGGDFNAAAQVPQKEVLFGGMMTQEILDTQNQLLEDGIYPDRLELGSLSVLGALVEYLTYTNNKSSTLVLEVGPDLTNSYIVTSAGVEASRPIPQGYESMVPLVQKELGLKDADSARKLFLSNTFDFTGMGPLLIKRLVKELQSSIGFYEVQTGQSVGLLYSLLLPQKLAWLDGAIASSLGVESLKVEPTQWLSSRQVTLSEAVQQKVDPRWFGLFSLMANYNLANVAESNAVTEKKTDSAGPQTPNWHPNFRNYETLPDTKVVRTAFFTNVGASVVALSLLIYVGLDELQLHGLHGQIQDVRQQIERDEAASNLAVAQYQKFQENEARIKEVDAFVKSKLGVAELITNFSRTLPVNVALDSLDLRDNFLTIRGTVRGAPDKATGYASNYVDVLRTAPEFESLFLDVSLTNLSRVQSTGRLAIEIVIKLATKEGK